MLVEGGIEGLCFDFLLMYLNSWVVAMLFPKFSNFFKKISGFSRISQNLEFYLFIHGTFWEIVMAKKYPVDFEATVRTPSSRALKRAPT